MILVDTNVLADLFGDDPDWADWSEGQLRSQSVLHALKIDPIVYAELAAQFRSPADLDAALEALRIEVATPPRAALFLAGKAYVRYRRRGGTKTSVLPDFLIGAHAAVRDCSVVTRDPRRYRDYFPTLSLVSPT